MNSPDLSSYQADTAAASVLAAVGQGKWRKARDAAKELCRKDKPRYLPLLIAANVGLAEELMGRGLAQDAATVLDYLKTIAPPEIMVDLLARHTHEQATASVIKAAGLNPREVALWHQAVAAAAGLEAGGEPAAAAALRAADGLVLADWILPDVATKAFAEELGAVRKAVRATGMGDWEAARAALQTIPRRSLFQHWRFFLRGVRHAHLGETAEAQRCFEAIPADSVPARAALPYQDLLGLPRTAATSTIVAMEVAAVPLLAALAGLPAAWVTPLTEAQRFWQRGQLDKAYEALVNPLRQHFPSGEPGLMGTLTDVVLAGSNGKSPLPVSAQEDLVDQLLARYHKERFRSDRERLFSLRFVLHEDGESLEPATIEEYALDLIKTWSRVCGPDPLRESAVWSMVARELHPMAADGSLCSPANRDLPIVRRMHEKAAALDPENSAPAVSLALFHHAVNDRPAYQKQLASLTDRFPEDKDILMLSAVESLSRKSWDEALTTLRHARELHPSDSVLMDLLVNAVSEQAVAIAKKGKPVPEALWQEIEPLLLELPAAPDQVPVGFSFGRTRWVARSLRGVIGPALSKAEAATPALGVWFHYHTVRVLVARFGLKMRQAVPSKAPTWQDLHWLLHLMLWDQDREAAAGTGTQDTLLQCVGRLKSNAKTALSTSPGTMLLVLHFFSQSITSINPDWIDTWKEAGDVLADLIGVASEKKQASYHVRLAAIILPRMLQTYASFIPQLQAILAEATAAGDASAMKLAAHYLKFCQECGVPQGASRDGHYHWEISDAQDAGDHYVDDDDDHDEYATSGPTEDERGMMDAVRLIAALNKLCSPAEVKIMRRKMEAGGMPPEIWDAAAALAKIHFSGMTRKEAERIANRNGDSDTFIQPDLFS